MCYMAEKYKDRRGLSLLEVLVSIALLSLLMVMVLPLYNTGALWIVETRNATGAGNYAYSLLEAVRAQAPELLLNQIATKVNQVPLDLDLGVTVPDDFQAQIIITPFQGHSDLYKVEAQVFWQEEGVIEQQNMVTLICWE